MAIDTEERTENNNPNNSSSSSNKKIIIIVISIVAGLLVLGIIGSVVTGFIVKKGAESVISTATGSKVKIDSKKGGGKVTFKSDNGKGVEFESSESGGVKLNKKFPKDDVKIYPNATIKSSGSSTFNGGTLNNAFLSTKDSKDKVVEFYEKSFEGSDWESTLNMDNDSGATMVYHSKSRNMTASVNIRKADRKGLVNIDLSATITADQVN